MAGEWAGFVGRDGGEGRGAGARQVQLQLLNAQLQDLTCRSYRRRPRLRCAACRAPPPRIPRQTANQDAAGEGACEAPPVDSAAGSSCTQGTGPPGRTWAAAAGCGIASNNWPLPPPGLTCSALALPLPFPVPWLQPAPCPPHPPPAALEPSCSPAAASTPSPPPGALLAPAAVAAGAGTGLLLLGGAGAGGVGGDACDPDATPPLPSAPAPAAAASAAGGAPLSAMRTTGRAAAASAALAAAAAAAAPAAAASDSESRPMMWPSTLQHQAQGRGQFDADVATYPAGSICQACPWANSCWSLCSSCWCLGMQAVMPSPARRGATGTHQQVHCPLTSPWAPTPAAPHLCDTNSEMAWIVLPT